VNEILPRNLKNLILKIFCKTGDIKEIKMSEMAAIPFKL